MKRVTLKVLDSSLKQVLGGEFTVQLPDDANILDLLAEVDASRSGRFFIADYPEYRSLLHMLWNPVAQRFYTQIALSAYTTANEFVEVRKQPSARLPDGLTIFLGLGLCKSDHEEVLDYALFQQALQGRRQKP